MASLKSFNRIALIGWLGAALAFTGAANAGSGESASTGWILTTQVLRDEVFRKIQPGLNASEVIAIIGLPYRKVRFEATKTTAWDYNYRDTWGYEAEFSVIFDDAGAVVGKFSTRLGNS